MNIRPENDIELCEHMSKARAYMDMAFQLWPHGRLRAMADMLANAQAAARDAEKRLNDIIFAKPE